MKYDVNRYFLFITIIIICLLLSNCSTTKFLNNKQYLLVKNKIVVTDKKSDFSKAEIKKMINFVPNKKKFGFFKTKLWFYQYSISKLDKKIQKKHKKLSKLNKKRILKGKDTLLYKHFFIEKLVNNSKSKPRLIDSIILLNSINNISKKLFNKGYFQNEVNYKIKYLHKPLYFFKKLFVKNENKKTFEEKNRNKKAQVIYFIEHFKPYRIKKIIHHVEDSTLIFKNNDYKDSKSLLKVGNKYLIEDLENEMTLIIDKYRNNGYYDFNQDYINYNIDTNNQKNEFLIIQNINVPNYINNIDIPTYQKYKIRNVYIQTENSNVINVDTLLYNNLHFISPNSFVHKFKLLDKNIFIRPNSLYNKFNEDLTYKKLLFFQNFVFVNITYEKIQKNITDSIGYLDCTILLIPRENKSVILKSTGILRNSNLGISGGMEYQNRNVFGGAENFVFRLKGGVEAISNDPDKNQNINEALLFNTTEYDCNFSMSMPKIIFFDKNKKQNLKLNFNKTVFNLFYNLQERTDFKKNEFALSFSYYWEKEKRFKKTIIFTPFDLSSILIQKTSAFEKRLANINNQFILSTYNNQIIPSTSISFILSRNQINLTQSRDLISLTLESSGGIFSLYNGIAGKEKTNNEYYEVFNNQYSQFIKSDFEIRKNFLIRKNSSFAFRFLTGFAYAYGNSTSIPYIKSYFGGGVNGNRAWKARSLGPGGVSDTVFVNVDKVGDMIIKFNLEYRFKIIKYLEGALFTDVGNIWKIREDIQHPKVNFKWNNFFDELGLGSGFGLRLNFDFLLIRLDAGLKIHDPSLTSGERWIFESKTIYNKYHTSKYPIELNYSIGIGYPF